MKLYSFPTPLLSRAITKRMNTLPPESRAWFAERWNQKAYKKAFLDNKAGPLVYLLAKCKTMEDAEFEEQLGQWDAQFYPVEVDVLMPLIQGDGLLQLMQKKIPPERIEKIIAHLQNNLVGPVAKAPASPDASAG